MRRLHIRCRASLLILSAASVLSCSPRERILKDRQPSRVLLFSQQHTTQPSKYFGASTRTDSIWLLNGEVTTLGTDRFRVWVEKQWYNDPPPGFGAENPMFDRDLLELDCHRNVYREGEKVGEVPKESAAWRAAAPETIMHAYLDSLCHYLNGT